MEEARARGLGGGRACGFCVRRGGVGMHEGELLAIGTRASCEGSIEKKSLWVRGRYKRCGNLFFFIQYKVNTCLHHLNMNISVCYIDGLYSSVGECLQSSMYLKLKVAPFIFHLQQENYLWMSFIRFYYALTSHIAFKKKRRKNNKDDQMTEKAALKIFYLVVSLTYYIEVHI